MSGKSVEKGEVASTFETSENSVENEGDFAVAYQNSKPDNNQSNGISQISQMESGEDPPNLSNKPLEEKTAKNDVVKNGIWAKFCLWIYKYRGILFALLTAIFLSLATFLVQMLQKMDEEYTYFLTCFWRFLGILVLSFPMIAYYQYYQKINVFETIFPLSKGSQQKTFLLLILRCLVGTCSFVFQFAALDKIPLADVSVIVFSSTVFVVFFAWIFIGEECGIVPTLIAFLTVIGVGIIARPPFIFGNQEMSYSTIGIVYALIAMITTTIAYVLIRFLREIHYSVMALAFGFVGTFAGLVLAYALDNQFILPKNGYDTSLFLAVAILSCMGQITLTLALKYEEAGPVSIVRSTDALFSFIWQTFIFIYPTSYSIIGAVIVIGCVFITGFRKWLISLNSDHLWKKRLWFLLK